MKEKIDLDSWSRNDLYHHFKNFTDPTFAIVSKVDVTKSYTFAKLNAVSFFPLYLFKCMQAINEVENFKLRIENDTVYKYNTIHASATIARKNGTFGFSFIEFTDNFKDFQINFNQEKERIQHSKNLFPEQYSLGCIHCSALPWFDFSSHKEPVFGNKNSGVPQLAFGKIVDEHDAKKMAVAVNVNHALVDGLHVGEFLTKFQEKLNIVE